MKTIGACLLLLLVAASSGKQLPSNNAEAAVAPVRTKRDLDITALPQNVVAYDGDASVTLTCYASGTGFRIQWLEYVYTPSGGIIADDGNILPGTPLFGRVSIQRDTAYMYNLVISPVRLSDAGTYRCIDANAPDSGKRQHGMELTVIATKSTGWNCSTTIRSSGVVIEDSYITNDCTCGYGGGLIPNLTWYGEWDFVQGYVATPEQLWAGMHFNVTRGEQAKANQLLLYFSGYFLPVDGNTADNVPTVQEVYQAPQMYVYWGPKNMVVLGLKPNNEYLVGDQLTCTSDAFPTASHAWQNLLTLEVFQTQVVTILPSWYGNNQTLRCQALNTIEGVQYTANIFIVVYVPLITDPPTTTPTTTTTPPPAVSPCRDLTGSWQATIPGLVSLCIQLDLDNNAFLTGLMKNGTQTFWLDIVGRSQAGNFAQSGFNGIWPSNIGMTSAVAECHRCYGTEFLLVNFVSRQKGSPCGVPGPVQYSDQYEFTRNPNLQCPNIAVTTTTTQTNPTNRAL
jgi:hypothetical protein